MFIKFLSFCIFFSEFSTYDSSDINFSSVDFLFTKNFSKFIFFEYFLIGLNYHIVFVMHKLYYYIPLTMLHY